MWTCIIFFFFFLHGWNLLILVLDPPKMENVSSYIMFLVLLNFQSTDFQDGLVNWKRIHHTFFPTRESGCSRSPCGCIAVVSPVCLHGGRVSLPEKCSRQCIPPLSLSARQTYSDAWSLSWRHVLLCLRGPHVASYWSLCRSNFNRQIAEEVQTRHF